MRLHKIDIQNFRLLAKVELLLEEKSTVIVGRNNSGKTSLTELFRRLLGDSTLPTAKPISSNEIRKLREKANMSQAAFARSLNLSVGYISQLERGAKQPGLASP